MPEVLGITLIVIALLAIAVAVFAYRNLNYDYLNENFMSKSGAKLGVNAIFELTRNVQDGTGNYDLYFGESFYDFSWFEGFDQEETLKNIKAPTLVMQVNPSKETAPAYCDEDGMLLSAMDRADAQRVCSLIPNSKYMTGFASMHDIHADCPKQFAEAVVKFKEQVEAGTFEVGQ